MFLDRDRNQHRTQSTNLHRLVECYPGVWILELCRLTDSDWFQLQRMCFVFRSLSLTYVPSDEIVPDEGVRRVRPSSATFTTSPVIV